MGKDKIMLMCALWFITICAYLILPYASNESEEILLDRDGINKIVSSDAEEVSFYLLIFSAAGSLTTISVLIDALKDITSIFNQEKRPTP